MIYFHGNKSSRNKLQNGGRTALHFREDFAQCFFYVQVSAFIVMLPSSKSQKDALVSCAGPFFYYEPFLPNIEARITFSRLWKLSWVIDISFANQTH